jgi:hypothetical protein
LSQARRRATILAMEDDDVQTVMTALFAIRADTQEILRLLSEDDDEEETQEEP